MRYNLRTGDRVTVTDHAADGKKRTECIVRILNKDTAVVFVPRYNAEITFNRSSMMTDNGRMEITSVDR